MLKFAILGLEKSYFNRNLRINLRRFSVSQLLCSFSLNNEIQPIFTIFNYRQTGQSLRSYLLKTTQIMIKE